MNSNDRNSPEGMMWDALAGNKLVTIKSVEQLSILRMERWDYIKQTHKFYWKNDPSYWWAKTTKKA